MDKYQRARFLNRMTYEIFEEQFKIASKKYLKGDLIDIGCGHKPYKELLKDIVSQHIGVDHIGTSHTKDNIDLFGSAYEIPAKDNSFDSAICTAVLEHLEEPEKAIRECFRVLKPDTYAIYSVPFMWHVHEAPRDFFRYTNFGLKYLFEKSGFEVIEIKPLSGFMVTFLQLHLYLIEGKLNRGFIKGLRILDFYIWGINQLGLRLNKIDNSKIWTWMYLVTARKPTPNPV